MNKEELQKILRKRKPTGEDCGRLLVQYTLAYFTGDNSPSVEDLKSIQEKIERQNFSGHTQTIQIYNDICRSLILSIDSKRSVIEGTNSKVFKLLYALNKLQQIDYLYYNYEKITFKMSLDDEITCRKYLENKSFNFEDIFLYLFLYFYIATPDYDMPVKIKNAFKIAKDDYNINITDLCKYYKLSKEIKDTKNGNILEHAMPNIFDDFKAYDNDDKHQSVINSLYKYYFTGILPVCDDLMDKYKPHIHIDENEVMPTLDILLSSDLNVYINDIPLAKYLLPLLGVDITNDKYHNTDNRVSKYDILKTYIYENGLCQNIKENMPYIYDAFEEYIYDLFPTLKNQCTAIGYEELITALESYTLPYCDFLAYLLYTEDYNNFYNIFYFNKRVCKNQNKLNINLFALTEEEKAETNNSFFGLTSDILPYGFSFDIFISLLANAYKITDITDIFSFNMGEVEKLINYYHNTLFKVYYNMHGTEEEKEKKRMYIKRLFLIINIDSLKPKEDTINNIIETLNKGVNRNMPLISMEIFGEWVRHLRPDVEAENDG